MERRREGDEVIVHDVGVVQEYGVVVQGDGDVCSEGEHHRDPAADGSFH